jgi:hypothetical protein
VPRTNKMKSKKKTNQPREIRKDRLAAADVLSPENLRPILRDQFGGVVIKKHQANRQRNLANLKILELIVSGKIAQQPGEDYFSTTCRIIASGASDPSLSAATKRTLHKALAEIRKRTRWTTNLTDIVEMREWGTKRAVVRTIMLITLLEQTIGSGEMAKWLERPNPNLNKQAPVHFLKTGSWTVLADFLDDMLTGSPT